MIYSISLKAVKPKGQPWTGLFSVIGGLHLVAGQNGDLTPRRKAAKIAKKNQRMARGHFTVRRIERIRPEHAA